MMLGLWQDLLFGARMLRTKPAFALTTVLTLALGIGANTALFSVLDAVLLRSLPFSDSERLVRIEGYTYLYGFSYTGLPVQYISQQEIDEVFAQLAAYEPSEANLTGEATPQRIQVLRVTADFFSMLGRSPVSGRAFAADDYNAGQDRVLILSHSLWQDRFGSDPGVIGKTVKLNGHSFTVIGIMPREFYFYMNGKRAEAWSPLTQGERVLPASAAIAMTARLRPGLSLVQAQERINALSALLKQRDQRLKNNPSIKLIPLREFWAERLSRSLFLLFGAVVCVLLIACANTANLMLARGAARQKEAVIRAALGATRWRLMRQWLTESLMLALLGGAFGVLFAVWCVDALVAIMPTDIPRIDHIGVDGRVLGFTLAVSVLTGLLFAMAPAWQYSKPELIEALKAGGIRSTIQPSPRLRQVLIVSEIALALMLLVGAGLLIKSFSKVLDIELGFNPHNVLMLDLSPTAMKCPDERQCAAFYQQVIERISAVPGVQYAGVVDYLPVRDATRFIRFKLEGQMEEPERKWASARIVSGDYFHTLDVPLIAGRYFTDRDGPQAPRVVIVNQSFAQEFFAGQNPLGKRLIRLGNQPGSEEEVYEIVGVVGNLKQRARAPEDEPLIYWLFTQLPPTPASQATDFTVSLLIRTAVKPVDLVAAIRAAIWEVDKDQPIFNVKTLEQHVGETLSPRRFPMLLLSIFAALALLLAAIGLYGVMSYLVAQRTHEIGIRMALGARSGDVLRLVIGKGLRLVLIGIATGLVGAFGLTRIVQGMMFDVSPTDPLTFLVITLVLTGVALLACYIPARRATKVDPMVALRCE